MHTRGDHALVSRVEVVYAKEHADPPGELLANDSGLRLAISPRQENAGLAPRRTDDHPTLRPAVVGQGWRVFDKLELQGVNEESNGTVVVADHECDELEMRHRIALSSARAMSGTPSCAIVPPRAGEGSIRYA